MDAPQGVAISVQGVSKDFVLPHEKANSIKSVVTGLYRRGKAGAQTQHALRDINFDIRKGEFFGIVGRNGSGKSTLLKIIAGIYQPTKGSVSVDGRLVPFIELGVGFNPELTGRENVFLNGAMLGFSEKQVARMYDEIVAFAELKSFMDQKLKNYSSGMQVRLAFSMATRAEADILLVDEVLAVGDADFQRKCFDYFRTLKRQHKTVVFVSHDMDSIREYCDRAVLIDQSKLVAEGAASDIAKAYVQLFTPSDGSNEGSSKKSKWGNGDAVISSVKMDRSIYNGQPDMTIDMTIKVKKTMLDGVLVGFTVKDQAGQQICGTNTSIVRRPIDSVEAGDRLQLSWKLPNIFNEGTYTVEPAVVSRANGEVCQWWDSALRFEVFNEQKTPYIVAPPVEVTVTRG